MTNNNHKNYLIIDLEATCCKERIITREAMEIIEIGAVVVDAGTLDVVDEYTTFIKPILNPTLTDFCKTLTTITQDDVDNAIGYKEAIEAFKTWSSQYEEYLFCSWGDYDKNQFILDAKLHNLDYPFNEEHLNIKKAFAKQQNIKPCGLDRALAHVGLELEGTHHRGIDDARNMARLMPFIVQSS
ncbi:MAG: Inhibitor of the KinA pathway to sporulation, predicted exonuclease [uncultured Sulfurovum sp.]|uniref:Inhibitor of the KinA pathway to sporulation, predicted exonuclease n=1 Tax=uncultured Sulfurovum sp. TaxID=269237 RepID=A0A6S6SIG2_9BACT|nr:MAG: Inhibitor of the KinA pathway to sporulation, predicted exonuclease [uncultured Sulfurovum sp.]